MCRRLRTVVRESCCHNFERQHPQMMQHDISGLHVAVRLTELSACDMFYQSIPEERERCNAGESSSVCTALSSRC